MPNRTIRILRLCKLPVLAALVILLTASCASVPAKLTHLRPANGYLCALARLPLEDLLTIATAEPPEENSSHALAHFIERWQQQFGASSEQTLHANIDGRQTAVKVRITGDPEGIATPLDYFESLRPAVDYQVDKIDRKLRSGHGAPLIAIRSNQNATPIEKFHPLEGIIRPLTAVAELQKRRTSAPVLHIRLLSPLQHEFVTTAGRQKPLAADFSAAWAALQARTRSMTRHRTTDLLKGKPSLQPQLYLMEPYAPNKEPVIMIHGLLSSPQVWTKLSNEFWGDAALRQRYQVWHYLYNTSAPALYSGRLLREQLRTLRPLLDPSGNDPAMQKTTVIAHSMGGLVTRGLITDPGMAFWDAGFNQPLDSLDLSEDDRTALKKAFMWQPEPHVKRVIFLAVPHRGSDTADSRLGKLGRLIVKPPNAFAAFYDRISKRNPKAFTAQYQALGRGRLDSVGALSPQQPTLKILADLPLGHPVRMHSVIGNENASTPLKQSTDGLVPYWSSHLDEAVSEKVIHTDHRLINHPQTHAEIRRILGK